MSTTEKRRGRLEALTEAERFVALFDGCCERWTIAGSIRRKSPTVGDVDHVTIPIITPLADAADLFATPKPVNLLWKRADELVKAGVIHRHVRDDGGYCWGNKQRSIIYRDMKHEIYTATLDSWGSQVVISTGPWEFSKRMVTGLLQNNRRNIDGYVWNCRKRNQCDDALPCLVCDGSMLCPEEKLSVNTEAEYFSLCGVNFCKPEDRR